MKNVVLGFLGTSLDMGRNRRWKPTVSLVQHAHFPVDRLEILHDRRFHHFATRVQAEVQAISPGTEVLLQNLDLTEFRTETQLPLTNVLPAQILQHDRVIHSYRTFTRKLTPMRGVHKKMENYSKLLEMAMQQDATDTRAVTARLEAAVQTVGV